MESIFYLKKGRIGIMIYEKDHPYCSWFGSSCKVSKASLKLQQMLVSDSALAGKRLHEKVRRRYDIMQERDEAFISDSRRLSTDTGMSGSYFTDVNRKMNIDGVWNPHLDVMYRLAAKIDVPVTVLLAHICNDMEYTMTFRDYPYCSSASSITRTDICRFFRDLYEYLKTRQLLDRFIIMKRYTMKDENLNYCCPVYNNRSRDARMTLSHLVMTAAYFDITILDLYLFVLYYLRLGRFPLIEKDYLEFKFSSSHLD